MFKGDQQLRDANDLQRLHKVLAKRGFASRRQAEELISQGLVKVNAKTIREQGCKVSAQDVKEVQGQIVEDKGKKYSYILLNKPVGIITSANDPQGRKTVLDLLKPGISTRVYPVGRLDYDTSGLLLLTNDGELTYRLTHPRYGVKKTYRVQVEGMLSQQAITTLSQGVPLEDGLTSPAAIKIVQMGKKGKSLSVVEITIHEGKNRQVRRMFARVGYPVLSLQRTAFGALKLDHDMKPGAYRHLLDSEVFALQKETRLIE